MPKVSWANTDQRLTFKREGNDIIVEAIYEVDMHVTDIASVVIPIHDFKVLMARVREFVDAELGD